ncbi:MAG: potassium channel family protein [archaeon]
MAKRRIIPVHEEIQGEVKRVHKELIKKINVKRHHKELLTRISDFLFHKPLTKIICIIGLIVATIALGSTLPEAASTTSLLAFIFTFVLGIYLVLLIIHTTTHSFKRMFNARNMFVLFSSYALFIFCLLLLFSISFSIVTDVDKGYLTYSTCNDHFDAQRIHTDPQISNDYFYFSAVTFFSVGYGDICPMGLAKILSIIISFIGHFVAVVIMSMVIYYYMKRKEN